jgi:hypothetical protein
VADFLERQVTALNARGPGTVISKEGEEMRFRWGNHKPMVQSTSLAATATLQRRHAGSLHGCPGGRGRTGERGRSVRRR